MTFAIFFKMTSTLQKLKVKNIYAQLSLFFIFQTWPKFIFNHFFMIVKGYTYFLVFYTLSDFLLFTFLVKFYFRELLFFSVHFSVWLKPPMLDLIQRSLLLQI